MGRKEIERVFFVVMTSQEELFECVGDDIAVVMNNFSSSMGEATDYTFHVVIIRSDEPGPASSDGRALAL